MFFFKYFLNRTNNIYQICKVSIFYKKFKFFLRILLVIIQNKVINRFQQISFGFQKFIHFCYDFVISHSILAISVPQWRGGNLYTFFLHQRWRRMSFVVSAKMQVSYFCLAIFINIHALTHQLDDSDFWMNRAKIRLTVQLPS